MITREKVINILEDIAVPLELTGENPFKSRACSNAARNLKKVENNPGDLARQGKLFEMEGIGGAIGKKSEVIYEYS